MPNISNKSTSENQGRQSPDPERESGAQKDAPSSGQGVNGSSNNKADSKSQLEGLSSNPKGTLDDHAKETTSKTVENTKT